jgi:NADH oxidase (H2O2-forming)
MLNSADVVIIGGSAAGATAAISCRRRYPDKKVIVIRKEEQVLVPCGIPYIFGTLGSPMKNLIPDKLLNDNDINIVVDTAQQITKERKVVHTEGGQDIEYDKLIIATGALPLALPIPGSEKENVFVIEKDIAYLQNMLDEVNKAKDIVIVGGGFIGAEFADECRKNRDNNVTIVERLPHCLQLAFDDEFCIEAEKMLTDRGVNIITNQTLVEILGDKRVSAVRLSDGRELKADVVIGSIGVRPDVELAKNSGLFINPATNSIEVDRYQRVVNEQDIFACGDCAVKISYFSGRPSKTWLASVATEEARVAAANLFGACYAGFWTLGVFSTQIGELAICAAGLTERQANEEGYNTVIGSAKATSKHPGSLPGSSPTSVKLVFSKCNGIILGGEVSGDTCAGELINVISACIQNRMTACAISTFQMGTHPMLCASPIAYEIVNAAEEAFIKIK